MAKEMTEGQVAVPLGSEAVIEPEIAVPGVAEDRVSVASNWQLVWWRFRKNKLALFSGLVLVLFYVIVLVPEFFSTQDPEATEAALAFIPMQGISFFDSSGLNITVPAVVGKRNAVTLRMEWKIDESKRVPIRFFAPGIP